MFEQSIVLPTPDKKRWTFAVSLTLQAAAVSIAMLIPLIYTDRLSAVIARGSIFAPPLPPPAPPTPQHAPRPQTQPRVARVAVPMAAFLVHHTPKPLAEIARKVFEDAVPDPGPYVAGATGSPTGGIPGLGTTHIHTPPPPPPQSEVVNKPEPKKAAAPLRVGGDVQNAKMIRRVLPVYPALAKNARVSGTVRLQGVISKEGVIEQLHVISGHPLLVPAAIEAVKQWVYRPTLLNGEPVAVIAPIDVHFTLSGN